MVYKRETNKLRKGFPNLSSHRARRVARCAITSCTDFGVLYPPAKSSSYIKKNIDVMERICCISFNEHNYQTGSKKGLKQKLQQANDTQNSSFKCIQP